MVFKVAKASSTPITCLYDETDAVGFLRFGRTLQGPVVFAQTTDNVSLLV